MCVGRPLRAGELFAERFQLVRKLGEGGMGQVWLAEQLMPVRRPVALKLIKAGVYDESVAHRFQSQRQSLAIMDHPAIAKVFEAGATPQGQPYFVMEYVPDLPITDYCDEHRLGIRRRLELLIQVCEGVQHAHHKAIIHRDLKPANMLVVEVDGVPVPRLSRTRAPPRPDARRRRPWSRSMPPARPMPAEGPRLLHRRRLASCAERRRPLDLLQRRLGYRAGSGRTGRDRLDGFLRIWSRITPRREIGAAAMVRWPIRAVCATMSL
jgi:serine/threonine protein kinase